MRVAVTYENGEIFQHFGHTAQTMDAADMAVMKNKRRSKKRLLPGKRFLKYEIIRQNLKNSLCY